MVSFFFAGDRGGGRAAQRCGGGGGGGGGGAVRSSLDSLLLQGRLRATAAAPPPTTADAARQTGRAAAATGRGGAVWPGSVHTSGGGVAVHVNERPCGDRLERGFYAGVTVRHRCLGVGMYVSTYTCAEGAPTCSGIVAGPGFG